MGKTGEKRILPVSRRRLESIAGRPAPARKKDEEEASRDPRKPVHRPLPTPAGKSVPADEILDRAEPGDR